MSEGKKPTIPDVAPLVRDYYRTNPSGGALHIVLDDGNISDGNVESCRQGAIGAGDTEGVRLAELLLRMSKTQRRKLHRVAAKGPLPGP